MLGTTRTRESEIHLSSSREMKGETPARGRLQSRRESSGGRSNQTENFIFHGAVGSMLIHDPHRRLDLVRGPCCIGCASLHSSRLSVRSLNRRLKLLSKSVPPFDLSAPTTWNTSSPGEWRGFDYRVSIN